MKHLWKMMLGLTLCLLLVLTGCGQPPAEDPLPPPEEEKPVNLMIDFHGTQLYPDSGFGDIKATGEWITVLTDGEVLEEITVTSSQPDKLKVEVTGPGQITLTKLQSFQKQMIDFTITYKGVDYVYRCNDDDWDAAVDGGRPDDGPEITHPETYAKFKERRYTDEELQAFVDEYLTLEEACDKLSTVSDVVQYLYLRGYRFSSEDSGCSAEYRFYANSGACVGGSALLNTLLAGDYEEHGYVYTYYARTEHVLDYFVLDGVYFYCDLVNVFNDERTDISRDPVCYMTTDPETFYDAWLEIEPHDLNDSSSDMYLAGMFTTAYCGDAAPASVMLRFSADGKYCHIPLSDAEQESLKILFMREGYTFDFSPEK